MAIRIKILLLLLSFCFSVSCTKKESREKQHKMLNNFPIANEPAGEDKPINKAQLEKHECESLMMSSDKPSSIWKMKNGQHLVVCNLSNYDKISDVKIKGWINIYKRPISHQNSYIREVDSEMPSSQITFQVEKQSDTTILVTKYILDPKSSSEESYDVAATQFKINCSTTECLKTKEVCVYKAPKESEDSKILDYVESITKGKESNMEKYGYYDTVIDKVMNEELSGNKRAIKLILETSRNKFKVDGAAAESFTDGYRVLSNLIELGCIKK